MFSNNLAVKQQTVKDQVYEILKHEIVIGKLKPGESINISKLTEELNISTAPVREALNMLAQDGLVTLNPRRHASVTNIDISDMEVTMRLRLLLEPYSAELSINNIPQEDIDQMRQKLNSVLEKPYDEETYIESDLELHDILYRYSNSDIVKKTLLMIKEYSVRLRFYGEFFGKADENQRKQIIRLSTEEHLGILDAVEDRDVDLLKRLVYEHIKNGTERNYSAHHVENIDDE